MSVSRFRAAVTFLSVALFLALVATPGTRQLLTAGTPVGVAETGGASLPPLTASPAGIISFFNELRTGYMEKPIDPETFGAEVERHLRNARAGWTP